MVAPAVLAGLYLFKKVVVYKGIKSYGFSRFYRRLNEVNIYLNGRNTNSTIFVGQSLRRLFRLPGEAYNIIDKNVPLMKVFVEFEKKLRTNKITSLPTHMIFSLLPSSFTSFFDEVKRLDKTTSQNSTSKLNKLDDDKKEDGEDIVKKIEDSIPFDPEKFPKNFK